MKKGIITVLCVLLLAGCSTSAQPWDSQQTAEKLLEMGSYDTGFVLLDSDQVSGLLPGIEECCDQIQVYESDSEIMNEIIVAHVKDRKQAEKVIRERQDYLLKESENYFPEQTGMIRDAVVDVQNDHLIFVISSDPEQIKQLIDQILK